MDRVIKRPAHEVILVRLEETTRMLMELNPLEDSLVGLYYNITFVHGKDLIRILWEMQIPKQDIVEVCEKLLDIASLCVTIPRLQDWSSVLVALTEELQKG